MDGKRCCERKNMVVRFRPLCGICIEMSIYLETRLLDCLQIIRYDVVARNRYDIGTSDMWELLAAPCSFTRGLNEAQLTPDIAQTRARWRMRTRKANPKSIEEGLGGRR